MKKVIIIGFCLFLLPYAFVYSQTETDTACIRSFENIFKVLSIRDKYETIQYIFKGSNQRKSFLFRKNGSMLNHYFEYIKGIPYFEKQKDSISDTKFDELKIVPVEWMSEEEVNSFIKQLNYTPLDAYKEYCDYIQQIKLDKEIYLECIDIELEKGDVSEYAKERLYYDFKDPRSSLSPPWITKLDFLRIFKEFVIGNDEEVLPDFLRVKAYLKCGCKI